MEKIKVEPYESKWQKLLKTTHKALQLFIKELYHVGSTNLPGLVVKPIIDIMCVIKNLKTRKESLLKLGYVCKGELNIPLKI